jgi:hypothetical protein
MQLNTHQLRLGWALNWCWRLFSKVNICCTDCKCLIPLLKLSQKVSPISSSTFSTISRPKLYIILQVLAWTQNLSLKWRSINNRAFQFYDQYERNNILVDIACAVSPHKPVGVTHSNVRQPTISALLVSLFIHVINPGTSKHVDSKKQELIIFYKTLQFLLSSPSVFYESETWVFKATPNYVFFRIG